MQRPLRSQSPKRVGSGPLGPPSSPVCGLRSSGKRSYAFVFVALAAGAFWALEDAASCTGVRRELCVVCVVGARVVCTALECAVCVVGGSGCASEWCGMSALDGILVGLGGWDCSTCADRGTPLVKNLGCRRSEIDVLFCREPNGFLLIIAPKFCWYD